MTAADNKTIGVFAEAFGFGPASKASSIARGCIARNAFHVKAYGHSVAKEYFEREGFGPVVEIDILSRPSAETLSRVRREIDLAVIALQPEWACALQGYVPVIYVDSLGFMWNSDFFERYPSLKKVDAYVVQDFFNAANALQSYNVQNVVPTGAIIARPKIHVSKRLPGIVHLGGLINIFSPSDGVEYANFALSLVRGFVKDALLSECAAASIRQSEISLLSLDNAGAAACFAASDVVFTSPGLTALLELAFLRANVIPLPPQNYSQALIISYVSRYLHANPIWNFLKRKYLVEGDLPEKVGVELVLALNRRYAMCQQFQTEYRQLVENATDLTLPDELRAGGDGVAQCVDMVEALLLSFRTK